MTEFSFLVMFTSYYFTEKCILGVLAKIKIWLCHFHADQCVKQ